MIVVTANIARAAGQMLEVNADELVILGNRPMMNVYMKRRLLSLVPLLLVIDGCSSSTANPVSRRLATVPVREVLSLDLRLGSAHI